MAVATFDTLKFANTLKAAGVPPAQAEAEAQAFAEVIQINLKELVTKDDLKREVDDAKKELKQEIADVKREIKDVEQRLNTKIDLLAAELKNTRTELKGEIYLLKWMMGVVLAALLGVGGLLVRILFLLGR